MTSEVAKIVSEIRNSVKSIQGDHGRLPEVIAAEEKLLSLETTTDEDRGGVDDLLSFLFHVRKSLEYRANMKRPSRSKPTA